jgi:hypothetical protein
MAALLDRFQLRQHAVLDSAVPSCVLPIGLVVDFDLATARRRDHSIAAHAPAAVSGGRPRLVATWHQGANGHPVCAWSLSEGVPASG